MIDETSSERIAIIAESNHVSQSEAEAMWLESQKVAPDHLLKKIERARELSKLQQMRKHSKSSFKMKAGGE